MDKGWDVKVGWTGGQRSPFFYRHSSSFFRAASPAISSAFQAQMSRSVFCLKAIKGTRLDL